MGPLAHVSMGRGAHPMSLEMVTQPLWPKMGLALSCFGKQQMRNFSVQMLCPEEGGHEVSGPAQERPRPKAAPVNFQSLLPP